MDQTLNFFHRSTRFSFITASAHASSSEFYKRRLAEGHRIDADPNPDLSPEIKTWRKNIKTTEKET
jgi:hypothetical protein